MGEELTHEQVEQRYITLMGQGLGTIYARLWERMCVALLVEERGRSFVELVQSFLARAEENDVIVPSPASRDAVRERAAAHVSNDRPGEVARER